jgi:hypothetical protein
MPPMMPMGGGMPPMMPMGGKGGMPMGGKRSEYLNARFIIIMVTRFEYNLLF